MKKLFFIFFIILTSTANSQNFYYDGLWDNSGWTREEVCSQLPGVTATAMFGDTCKYQTGTETWYAYAHIAHKTCQPPNVVDSSVLPWDCVAQCPVGLEPDPITSECVVPVPPSDCSDTNEKKYFTGDCGEVSHGGCNWLPNGNINFATPDGQGGWICGNSYSRDGTQSDPLAPEGVEDVQETDECKGDLCFKDGNPPGCVTYKGTVVCPDPNNDNCISDGAGNTVCANQQKNCFEKNGQVVCTNDEPVSDTNKNCIKDSNGKETCFDDKIKETETETKRTEQIDPNTTKETTSRTKSDNIKGNEGITNTTTKTTYTDPATGEQTTTTDTERSGDCDPTIEECGDGGSASGGETCDAPPACDGDLIHCHQIRLDWEQFCSVHQPTPFDEAGIDAELAGQVDTLKLQEAQFDFTTAIDSTYFTPTNNSSVCPADVAINLLGRQHVYSYQPICDVANSVNPFIIFAGLIASIYILFREQS